uniref:tRNA (adenosine(37)-N6)-dimethylallyltransferase MiaA n=1 Tax=Alistipes sp. TaxID=1872444 RepID=UPI004055AF48
MRRLVVIVGPTGSGKTSLSIRLAEHYGAPILSMDSRQFYRGIPIGTAQPTAEELQRAPHYLIASHDLDDALNCGSYETLALGLVEELFLKSETVIAVGGSGLYVKALCEGMDDLPVADEALREELAGRLEREGLPALVEELKQLDPRYWAEVDRQNPARVLRALEVCLQSGRPYSEQRTGVKRERNFEIIKIGVDMPREELYRRVDSRVDQMIEEGLEAEARRVYPLRHLNSLQTVGYKELFEYFDGKITREEAIELIKRNSRRYAKRQLTWFRRDNTIRWFHPTLFEEIFSYIDTVR